MDKSKIAATWLSLAATCCGPPMPEWAKPASPTVDAAGPIIVVSDTQRTSWPETFFGGREQNEDARRALVWKIALKEHPAFVVHLGDLVTSGGDLEEWEYFDRLVSPLTVRGVRIVPTLGNHDYWKDPKVGLKEASRRFPELNQGTFYSMRYRALGLIWLNTNLEGNDADAQARWFDERLQAYQSDRSIRGVLVFTHHPPYTNGKDRSGNQYVLLQLLPRFVRYSKAVAFISGHVHGYERFSKAGKTYVVTGGGGGPRVEYFVGTEAHPVPDFKTKSGARRAFNYVVIEPTDSLLRFTVKCLEGYGLCKDGVLDTFVVPLPPPEPTRSRSSGNQVVVGGDEVFTANSIRR